jgi:NADH-quinone oxidoreductase subunit E
MVTETKKINFKHLHYDGIEGQLIPLLQTAQEKENYISEEAIQKIHEQTGIPTSQIYGVATFYAQFRFTPVGKHIVRVCMGTACHVNRAKEITQTIKNELGIEDGETTEDQLFTLETVSCLGCCSLAPVIMINDSTYGNLTTKEVKKIIKQYKKGEES